MRKKIVTTFVLVMVTCMFSSLSAQSGRGQVERGNKLFAEEKYDEANNKYRDAQLENPESPIVHFNIGDVLYKKRNYEDALKAYEKTLSADDILLQSKSYYNMGNTLYRQNKLAESIMAYKKALELNPDDEDAKFNLEYVRAKLKDEANKQQQNQDQQQNQQQQQDQQQGESDQNQEEQNSDEQQKQRGQEQQQQEREQQEAQPSQDQQNENPEQQEQQQEQQAGEPKEISKEDAERILNALQNEEQDLLKEQKPERRGRAFRGKDW